MENLNSENTQKHAQLIRPWHYAVGIAVVVIALVAFFVPRMPDKADKENTPQTVTGYSVLDKGDLQFELMAEINGELEKTNLDYSGVQSVRVQQTADLDGDGNQDCLILWWTGGNCNGCEGVDLVYYSQDDNSFHKIEDIVATEVEEWKGKPSLVERRGISIAYYVLEDGHLKKVEDKTADVGKTIWKRSRADLFPVVDEMSEDKELWFDMDGDGEDEMLTFGHDNSHANMYGNNFYLTRISWSNGRTVDSDVLPIAGEEICILEHPTNGLHDFLTDNKLFRWNGSQYEQWHFDGKKLTKES